MRRNFLTRVCIVALAFVAVAAQIGTRAGAATKVQTWLVVSDVHLDPFDRHRRLSLFGSDTNLALFRSALTEMKRRVPEPTVVLIPGDFLAHDFGGRAAHGGIGGAEAAAIRTMGLIAGAFARAFPNARFAVALGNNDAPCGDYHSALRTPYLRTVARIWAPLVDRGGTAPDFERSFARTGSYTANLPLPGLRLVVLDDVPLSALYSGDCADGIAFAPAEELAWLHAALATTPPGTHNVVMMHVPPGYDAFSTERTRGFFPWPFLSADANDAVLRALSNPDERVRFGIAGHAHRFDFRFAGSVPIVVFGSLSPVYHNNPAFYALDVGADGEPLDVRTFAFDEWTQAWQPERSFDRKWRVTSLDAASLQAVHVRLGRDDAMRRAWDAASSAWPSNWGIAWGDWGSRWLIPWCAQAFTRDGFTECAGLSARAISFRAALAAISIAAGILLAGATLLASRPRRPRETSE